MNWTLASDWSEYILEIRSDWNIFARVDKVFFMLYIFAWRAAVVRGPHLCDWALGLLLTESEN